MPRPRGHPDNSLIGSLGNAVRWAAVKDRRLATQPGRDAFNDRFLREAREKFGDLPPDELAYRAERLRRAHFLRLSLKSAQARRARREAEKTIEATEVELQAMVGAGPSDDSPEAA